MTPNEILQHFTNVRQAGSSQYAADCPACCDNGRHLYIAFAPDGKILLDCKKGCSFSEIVSAAGLKASDCFGENPVRPMPRVLLREHVYTYEKGGILAKKQIYDTGSGKKQCVWYRLEKGRYIKGLNGAKIPLYHLDRLMKSDGTVFTAEGEKDVETLERMGFTATTSPNGAGSKWRKDFAECLKGRDVVILTDNDDTGESYGASCADMLKGTAASVKLIPSAAIYPDVKHKGDISDIAAELGYDEALRLLDKAVEKADLYEGLKPVPPAAAESFILEKLKQLKPHLRYSKNDRGNGELFSEVFGEAARYNITAKEWYVYRDGCWREDTGGMNVNNFAKELYDNLLVYAMSLEESLKTNYIEHINKLGRLNVRENMIKDARSRNFIRSDMLDRNDWLFNCKNGTYDLKNGTFRSHSPDDLLSKMSNVVYDPNAASPDFEKFLNEIMCGCEEKKAYLLTALGYSLTGDTSQECMFIIYGSTTRNGKGTLMETISYMLGGEAGYAMSAVPETLAKRQNKDSRQASGDIARLKGARFLNVSEPEKGMNFDVALIKTLTGRDTITARHLHQSEFQFLPSFKLFINTNYLPHISDDTVFSSERINVITFDRHFTPEERDRNLKDRLKTECNISGIFNICLKGLESYMQNGLVPPPIVQGATAEYRRVSDRNGMFVQDCLEQDSGSCITVKAAYDAYTSWCKDNNYCAENKSNFIASLRKKQMISEKGTVNGRTMHNVIKGYRISGDYSYPTNDYYYENQWQEPPI